MNPGICPICQKLNHCQRVSQTQGPCWCFSQAVTAAVLASIPEEARGFACVCQTCCGEINSERSQAVQKSEKVLPA